MPQQATRNAIFTALLEKLKTIQFPPTIGTPVIWSQRFIPWENCAQPAVMLIEGVQRATEKVFGAKQWRLQVLVLIYFKISLALDGPVPAQTINDLLDAVEKAMQPDVFSAGKQTLGGVVTHAFIDGSVVFDDGTVDRSAQALVSIPITLVVA